MMLNAALVYASRRTEAVCVSDSEDTQALVVGACLDLMRTH